MPATSRATVVLPVPGLPTNTRCRVIVGTLSPAASRLASILSTATWRWISPLTASRPTRASSSASSSSSDLGGTSGSFGASASAGFSASAGGAAWVGWPDRSSSSGGAGLLESVVGGSPKPPTMLVSASRTALSCWVTARPDSAAMRSISSSVSTWPGVLGRAVRPPAGTVAGAGRTAPSWAAAAVEALPITRGVGVPSIAAAVQTSLRAVA